MLSVGEFYPSFSAFTFPFVITAIGLKLTTVFLSKKYNFSILNYPARLAKIAAVVLVIFVSIKYLIYLCSE